jgi:hypothetical protein
MILTHHPQLGLRQYTLGKGVARLNALFEFLP